MAENTSSKPLKTKSSTPRDRLAEHAEKAGLDARALKSVQHWLEEQFVADEFAKLSQGGHAETQVPLRRVFVDLPVSESPLQKRTVKGERTLLLQLLATLPSVPLKPYCEPTQELDTTLFAESEQNLLASGAQKLPRRHPPPRGRALHDYAGILLIGGPGQGKSTLGQLACQLHRASLLLPQKERLPSKVLEALTPFVEQEKERSLRHRLEVPKEALLPLRIVLPEAASWLAEEAEPANKLPALLRFLAAQPGAKKHQLEAETLLALAGKLPSLLFLDGFDEVGATTDRQRIVEAVQELIAKLGQQGASTLIVATTRPQGYAGELSRIGAPLVEKHLAPLTAEEALEYAQRLVEAKLKGIDEQHKALQRLREAAKEPATARLLETPLQVTILTALVQQQGRVPGERWKLFLNYFNFTLNREIERNTYASELLATHRGHIEALHMRVGLLLQVEAESDGRAASRVSRTRLEEIVQSVLQENEFGEPECLQLGREMVDAAEKRLVFLVEPEPGLFGFEIRSLQEFMAAWALTEGREKAVEERFRQVAKAPLFRNVLLFMASRFFSERSGLRELPVQVCAELDEDPTDAVARLIHSGAMLALELLEEGAVQTQPKRARALMERATHLLDLEPGVEHGRLARVADEHTAQVLRSALETRLGAETEASESLRQSAWVCLLELLNRKMAWAWPAECANTFWPALRKPVALLDTILRSRVWPGEWLLQRIVAEAEQFPPENLYLFSVYQEAPVTVPRELEAVLLPSHLESLSQGMVLFIPLRQPGSAQGTEDGLASGLTSPAWRAWDKARRFALAPSRQSLAAALRAIAEGLPVEKWPGLGERSPWPLAACLTMADSLESLQRIEGALLEGRLGEVEEWYSAQQQWRALPSLDYFLDSMAHELPWSIERLQEGPPLSAVQFTMRERLPSSRRLALAGDFTRLSQLYKTARSAASRRKVAALGLKLLRWLPPSVHLHPSELRLWLEEQPWAIVEVLNNTTALERSDRLELLLSGSFNPIPEYFDELIVSRHRARVMTFLETPSDPELLLTWLYTSNQLWEGLFFTPRLDKLRDILRKQPYDHPMLKAAAALLRIYLGDVGPGEEETFFQPIAVAAQNSPALWSKLEACLRSPHLSATVSESLLLMAYSATKGHHAPRFSWLYRLRGALQARRTGLNEPASWDRLALPLPYPLRPVSPPENGGLPVRPVVLKHLRLHRVRGLTELSLALSPPSSSEEGQWVVLLGPNGAGKTTILRSLALALRNLKSPSLWPRGTFAIPWLRMGDLGEAYIEVTLEGNVQHLTRIRYNGSEKFFQTPEQTTPRVFPLFAYGCRRGSALGGAAREVNLSDDDGPEIATLFDEGAALIHAETWLIQWDGDAQKNPERKAIFDAVMTALCELLAVERIEVRDQRVWITEPGRSHPLPMKALSDGYLTTTGWFLDLVARWIDLARQSKWPIGQDFLKRMTGLVLLDEIDLYLHPQWQVDVISRTRKLLPRMSFIVTTHNPLTLVGARAEEIWILSTQNGRVTAQKGTETPMLLTGGQLFSRYFGIKDIMPHELGKCIASLKTGVSVDTQRERGGQLR